MPVEGDWPALDPELVSIVYGLYLTYPMDQYRAYGVFGAEVAVPADASDADRLLGRQPSRESVDH
jgi:hypothetical protein